jgi:hypothetical protein
MTTPDLLACLLFEIWFSEIQKDIFRFRELADYLDKHPPKEPSQRNIVVSITAWVASAEAFLLPITVDKYLFDRRAQSDLPAAIDYSDWDLTLDVSAEAMKFESNFEKGNEDRLFYTLRRFLLLEETSEPKNPKTLWSYSIQLHQAWLLLLEVMDFRAFEQCQWSFELACDRNPDPTAPAVRHWYKTACAAAKGDLDGKASPCGGQQTRIPVRLPGYFTVRGDWFLATAEGSRSARLAAQAIDLLSSRRANRTRLHLGLGLPVRDLTSGDEFASLRTGLTLRTPTGLYRPICRDILNLGGGFLWHVKEGTAGWWPGEKHEKTEPPEKAIADNDPGFYWLFRSGLRDYDRQAVVISQWILRLFEWTVHVRFDQTNVWKGGFDPYDQLETGNTSHCKVFESWKRFFKRLKTFSADLDAATQGADIAPAPREGS